MDLRLTVAYGLPIAEVARQVESSVRYTLRHALDREPDRVSIRIGQLVHQHGIPPAAAPAPGGPGPVGPRSQRDGRRLMPRRSCDGAGFLAAFRSAVARLEANVDEINALNVFPVPDGDTGTNMLATVKAALEEADKAGPGADADRIAQAASFGALMGARGNSGVITSQIFKGIEAGSPASAGSTGWTSRTPWTSARRPPTRPSPSRSRARS